MEPNQAGVTALVTAYSRAYHAANDRPLIFNDFLAGQLFSEPERAFFNTQTSGLLKLIDPELAARTPDPAEAQALVMQLQTGPITLSRSHYCEDELEKAVAEGIGQYVILGAGFDTFTYRHPELADKVQVFEVDHPVTQRMKRERIVAAGWQIPRNLHMVPVDFLTDNLMDSLIRAGFSAAQKSFFSWLGVTYYLTIQSISDTLAAIAGSTESGSMIVFDYIDADGFDPRKACRAAQFMQFIARQAGEPMLACFEPEKLGSFLQSSGFKLVEDLTPEAIDARYFLNRQDRYRALGNIHIACAMVN